MGERYPGAHGPRDGRRSQPPRRQTGPGGSGRRASGRALRPASPAAGGTDLGIRGELLYGRNGVAEALRGRRRLNRLLIADGVHQDDRIRDMIAVSERNGVAQETVHRLVLDDATNGANHQGVGLDAGPYQYAELDDLLSNDGTVLILDHLQDPQNIGTLLRAAEAAGVAGVVIPRGPFGQHHTGRRECLRWSGRTSGGCSGAEPGTSR